MLNRLTPDHTTIANFRVDNRAALTLVCRGFVQFCRSRSLYGGDTIAIDGSKFMADNNRSSMTRKKDLKRQVKRLDTDIATLLDALEDDDTDEQPHSGGCNTQAHGLTLYVPVNRSINNHGDGGLFDRSAFSYHAGGDYYECPAGETLPQTTKSTRDRLYLYTTEACTDCRRRERCAPGKQRSVSRHFEEDVLNEVADRTEANPMMMRRRKGMVEHPFGALKRRMDSGQ